MSIEFTIDIIEHKKDRLFITGLSLTELTIEDTFSAVYQYGKSKKSKTKIADSHLTIETIIVDGEPVSTLSVQQSAMIILVGDSQAIQDQVQALRWRKKSGRFIRTSEQALTLADS